MCNRLKYFRTHLKKGQPLHDDDIENEIVETHNDHPGQSENLELEEAACAIREIRLDTDTTSQEDDLNDINLILRNEVRYLRSVMVTDENMDIVKQKLIKTLDYRANMVKDCEIYFRVEFPYFFSNPELVCMCCEFSPIEFLTMKNLNFLLDNIRF